MNDPMIIAGAITLIIPVIVTGIVKILNAIAENKKQNEKVMERVEEIHALADGNFSKVTKELAAAHDDIRSMAKSVVAKKRVR